MAKLSGEAVLVAPALSAVTFTSNMVWLSFSLESFACPTRPSIIKVLPVVNCAPGWLGDVGWLTSVGSSAPTSVSSPSGRGFVSDHTVTLDRHMPKAARAARLLTFIGALPFVLTAEPGAPYKGRLELGVRASAENDLGEPVRPRIPP
ncbi:MAG: hypothetical protein U0263_32790 [Polyangiaceae bacterium]